MSFTERLRIVIDTVSKDGVAGLQQHGAAAKVAGVEQQNLASKSSIARGALDKLGLSGVSTGSILKGAVVGGALVGGAALAKFALDGVDKFASLTSEVRAFQRIAKTSAEDSSELVFAVKRLGIEPDAAAAAVGRMAQRIGAGTVDLKEFGIEVEKNKDGTVDLGGTLLNVADHFSKIKDGTQQADEGMKIFGKGWQTLSPLLTKGKEDLREIFELAEKQGLIFDDAQLEAGKKYTLAMKDLHTAVEGLQVQLGQAFVPTLTSVAGGFSGIVEGINTVAQSGTAGSIAFNTLLGNVLPLKDGFEAVGALLSGDFHGALESATRSIPLVGDAVAELVPGLDSGEDSAGAYADAQQRVAETSKKVADLAAEGKRGTDEYRDAQREAKAAGDEFARVNDRVGQALEGVATRVRLTADEIAKLHNLTLGVAGAQQNYTLAVEKLAEANTAVNFAQLGLNSAIEQYGPDSLQAAQAAQALHDAQRNQEAASQSAAQATLTVDAMMRQFTETGRANRDAIDQQIHSLQVMQMKYPETAGSIQPLIDRLIVLKAKVDEVPPGKDIKVTADTSQAQREINDLFLRNVGRTITVGVKTVAEGAGRILGESRARGGPVKAGELYKVGDNPRGWEWFVPDRDGTIVPPESLRNSTGVATASGAGSDRLDRSAELLAMAAAYLVSVGERSGQRAPATLRAGLATHLQGRRR